MKRDTLLETRLKFDKLTNKKPVNEIIKSTFNRLANFFDKDKYAAAKSVSPTDDYMYDTYFNTSQPNSGMRDRLEKLIEEIIYDLINDNNGLDDNQKDTIKNLYYNESLNEYNVDDFIYDFGKNKLIPLLKVTDKNHPNFGRNLNDDVKLAIESAQFLERDDDKILTYSQTIKKIISLIENFIDELNNSGTLPIPNTTSNIQNILKLSATYKNELTSCLQKMKDFKYDSTMNYEKHIGLAFGGKGRTVLIEFKPVSGGNSVVSDFLDNLYAFYQNARSKGNASTFSFKTFDKLFKNNLNRLSVSV